MERRMDDNGEFEQQVAANIAGLGCDIPLKGMSNVWLREVSRHRYAHNFRWMGLPILQLPQDIVAMQELVWRVRPKRIVETGVARGGSLVFYASMLQLIGGEGRVIGVDIDIRPHNRRAIESHPMADRIDLVDGPSTDMTVARQVRQQVGGHAPVLVSLDSNHTHAHVLRELELYGPLVTKGSYLVVFDTAIAQAPPDFFSDRPWGPDDNPKTAVDAFLDRNDRFEIDRSIPDKLQITVASDGYLRCIKE